MQLSFTLDAQVDEAPILQHGHVCAKENMDEVLIALTPANRGSRRQLNDGERGHCQQASTDEEENECNAGAGQPPQVIARPKHGTMSTSCGRHASWPNPLRRGKSEGSRLPRGLLAGEHCFAAAH